MPARILLVDDEPNTRGALARVLMSAGYLVTTAIDGEEAIRLVQREGCWDLIVLDYHLGAGRTGAATGLELAKVCPEMPVLIVSGYSEIDLPDRWVLLQKPIESSALLRAVGALLCQEPPP